jgi:tetratricopeptide (TPR) repeat protein
MATYAGNTSLSTAVKDRVISTFQQTLALYKEGRLDEVIQGCGLILRMDPMFDPAKKLMEKTRNPSLPVDVDTLLPASDDDAMAQARAAMAARDYQKVLNITTEVLTNDLMNDEARILGDQAREKVEAAPFVEQFLRKCEQHINENNIAAARQDLDKARSLDSDHPAIPRMEQLVARGTSGAQPAVSAPQPATFSSPAPSFVVDQPAPGPSASGRAPAPAADFGFTFEEEKSAAPPTTFSFDSFAAEPAPAAPSLPPSGFSFDAPTPAAPSPFSFDAPAAPVAPPPPAPPAQTSSTLDALGSFSFGNTTPSADAPFAGGFSFDSPAPAPAPAPPPAAPAAAPGAFDFATASIDTSPDDQRKIQQYLTDGDRAFDAGEFQQAIDLWSRIFLIDVTNEQASDRIERAKVKRRDVEQRVEGTLTAAIGAFDRGDKDGARAQFADVLRADPTNQVAHDYLERLTAAPAAASPSYDAPYSSSGSSSMNDDIFADDAVNPSYEESQLRPPDPMPKSAAKSGKAAASPQPSAKKSPVGLIAVVVGLVVLLGGGYFAWTKFMAPPKVDTAATAEVLKDAQALAQQGRYDQAIAMLQDVKPNDPMHDRALVMMADFQHKKTVASEMINGRPASEVFQEYLTNGKTAFDAHDYVAAAQAFEAAQRIKTLPPDMKMLYETASQQVGKLQSAQALFKERKFQDALTSLQPLAAADPENKSIQRMIIDAHFNLGATALQEDRLPDAISEFQEVMKLDPTDDLAKRSYQLATRYNAPRAQRDLLFKIYVKYLPLRQVS